MKKTVYVLGAGFSAPAGGPGQAQLLSRILSLPDSLPKVPECKTALRNFLLKTLHASSGALESVSLEDIYTPIDRCLADGVALRGMSISALKSFREQLEYLISLAIDRAFDEVPLERGEYVREFAKHLVNQASLRAERAKNTDDAGAAKKYDPFSIISLNWDIILDKALYRELGVKDQWEDGDYAPIGVVDYCCYISSVTKEEKRIRSGLWALGSRGYNVKLLKIHGSMNWLQCSNCQRLYVAFEQKENIPNYVDPKHCRHCEMLTIKATLQGALVMPTFLKDLSNFQIKLVWQNSGVELMEADRIVFMGYSLPHADFEFRQLLSRTVREKAKVHVVLRKGKDAVSKRRYKETQQRYREFFGSRNPTFEPAGVVEYVRKMVAKTAP